MLSDECRVNIALYSVKTQKTMKPKHAVNSAIT